MVRGPDHAFGKEKGRAGSLGGSMTMLKRVIFASVASLAVAGPGLAQTAMPFALDWQFEGPAAPYFMAIENGHFAAEGLDANSRNRRFVLPTRTPQSSVLGRG